MRFKSYITLKLLAIYTENNNVNKPFITFLKLVFLAFIFSSCSYQKTTLEIGSLFDPTWDFSDSAGFEFDENYVELKDGQIQLKPLDLEHSGDDFNNGSHVGSYVNIMNKLTTRTRPSLLATNVNTIYPEKSIDLVGYWRMEGGLVDSSASQK